MAQLRDVVLVRNEYIRLRQSAFGFQENFLVEVYQYHVTTHPVRLALLGVGIGWLGCEIGCLFLSCWQQSRVGGCGYNQLAWFAELLAGLLTSALVSCPRL